MHAISYEHQSQTFVVWNRAHSEVFKVAGLTHRCVLKPQKCANDQQAGQCLMD